MQLAYDRVSWWALVLAVLDFRLQFLRFVVYCVRYMKASCQVDTVMHKISKYIAAGPNSSIEIPWFEPRCPEALEPIGNALERLNLSLHLYVFIDSEKI
jgi:hypothetical protein